MNFIDAVKTCLTKFADFNGRAGLPEFWWFALFTFIAPTILSFVSSNLASIFSLVLLIPFAAVTTRRLHDINKSGWVQLWWNIASMIGLALILYGFASAFIPGGLAGGGSAAIGIVGLIIMLASIAFAIYLMVKASDTGDNQYGAPPTN